MASKYFNIVVIPQKTTSLRRIRIPFRLLLFAIVLLLCFLGGWGWIVYDYLTLRNQLKDFSESEKEIVRIQEEIAQFDSNYDSIHLRFSYLEAIHEKLKGVTRSEKPLKPSQATAGPKESDILNDAREKGILSIIASDTTDFSSGITDGENRFTNLVKFHETTSSPISRIPRGWPVKGLLLNEYGIRPDPLTGQLRSYFGINIATSSFSFVVAPADAIVLFARSDIDFNNLMILDHGNGIITRYGYISRFEVNEGDIVEQGEVIAQVGLSGQSDGPHLYYEVLLNQVL